MSSPSTSWLPQVLSGRAFTRQEIRDIQETVGMYPRLSRTELVLTLCEHLGWVTEAGHYKVIACGKALEKLEARGLLQLPARRRLRGGWGRRESIVLSADTAPEAEILGSVHDIAPVAVEAVRAKAERQRWDEYVERYHRLGYKRPCGAHQRYFVVGGDGRKLGCLLFAASAWALAERDAWIGWTASQRAQRLKLVVGNTRFAVFPWVRIKNLASKALSLAAQRIGEDWQQRYGYRPVLLETFVEVERYRGTCYQAANWIYVGQTQGRGRMDRYHQSQSPVKAIYVYPLVRDFRRILCGPASRGGLR